MLELTLCDTWQESPLGRIGDRWGNHIRNDLEGPFPETLSPSDHTLPLQCSNKSRLRASLRGGKSLAPSQFPCGGTSKRGIPLLPIPPFLPLHSSHWSTGPTEWSPAPAMALLRPPPPRPVVLNLGQFCTTDIPPGDVLRYLETFCRRFRQSCLSQRGVGTIGT